MNKQEINYSLYLVTDSTDAILGSKDLVDVVEQALLGGELYLLLYMSCHTLQLIHIECP
jgi:hypothetical protein